MICIALKRQIDLYSIDTSIFYNKNEDFIHNQLNRRYFYKAELQKKRNRTFQQTAKLKKLDLNQDTVERAAEQAIRRIDNQISMINRSLKQIKENLINELNKNTTIRILNHDKLRDKDIVSLFDSTLVRTMGVPINTLTEDLIIVKTYYFKVLEDLIKMGFIYKGEKYIPFTASAGQIRTKKTLFIKESTYERIEMSLTCGLTVESINNQGGVNINKYLAYLALCNSATDKWQGFDIDKVVVVDDMETTVSGLTDLIDDRTYSIERKNMDITIEHTDGCGMMLPRINKKSKMIRLPWVKGLLVPFPFDKFIREWNKNNPENKCGIIKDIYGKEYDILKDDIEIILTKSQFKMWKFYKDWDVYKNNYKKFRCQAGQCNEEPDVFENAKLNYQMLQTLTDIKDMELEHIAQKTKQDILKIGNDRNTMLKVLGVTKGNITKNYIQQALEIYPELLQDTYSKEIIKQTKASLVKKARSGKLDINGKYTFLVPDLYAFCEWLFLNDKNPKGLLDDGQVYCNLYTTGTELDCLRSPHLYKEHAVRLNVVDKEKSRWFITKGLYTSCHDLISKILQFDNDGDTSLVIGDQTLVNVAKRNMKDIVPLYYNMATSSPEKIDSNSIYEGLANAYVGGNIGMISNDITKIWNNSSPNLDVIKLLCMESNFTIDYAKTLYKPTRPKKIKDVILKYTKHKVPHFFMYAKDKSKHQVEPVNKSTVNRLKKVIPNPRINFTMSNVGDFDYKMLMKNKDTEIDLKCEVIKRYKELDLGRFFMIDISDEKYDNIRKVHQHIKDELLKINSNIYEVTDILIKYLYEHKDSSYKTTLWECFGDIIIENLKQNITQPLDDGWIMCEVCGKRVTYYNNRKYCDECQDDVDRVKAKKRMQAIRSGVRS